MNASTLKRISIILKSGALTITPAVYILKIILLGSAMPSIRSYPLNVNLYEIGPSRVLATVVNQTYGMTEDLWERIQVSSLSARIKDDPLWLILAVVFVGLGLVIDFYLTYKPSENYVSSDSGFMKRWYFRFCHVAVPIIFIGVSCLHYRDRLFLRWEFVILVTIAALPFLLPLLSIYIKGIGKDGIQFHAVFSSPILVPPAGGAAEFTSDPTCLPTPTPTPTPTLSLVPNYKKFGAYSRASQKILRTLWKFQREHFQNDFSKRWGFGLHPLASDFNEFEAGAAELRRDEIIQDDPRGMIFLTDRGVILCRDMNKALEQGGDIWTKF